MTIVEGDTGVIVIDPLISAETAAASIALYRKNRGDRPVAGALGLIPPTVDVTRTGQEETIDGVRIVFQITPGTEAPSEVNFYLPAQRALCMAENATHNLLTLRPGRTSRCSVRSRTAAASGLTLLPIRKTRPGPE